MTPVTRLVRATGALGRLLPALLATAAGGATAQAAFDGTWQATVVCSDHQSASGMVAKGYTLVMDATVRQGWLDGQYGKPGSANSLRLSGAIQPDGQASLVAEGFTGNPQYSIDRVPSSSRYSYTLKSQFEARRGSGQRVEGRPCEAVFVRP